MINVLFVDDDPFQLAIGKHFLEKTGDFTIDTLGSAREALASANLLQYDAIVSDYQMPDIDGIKLLQQIRSSGNTIPFILFTGKGREEIVIQALNEGVDFYVTKSVHADTQFAELRYKIQMAVQRKRDKLALTESEQALRESEEKYRSLADAAEDLIYIIDRDDRVVYVNRFGLAMLNKRDREVVGKPRRDLFPEDVSSRQYDSIQRVFTTGMPVRIESNVPMPGRDTWQDTSLVPLKSDKGTIRAVLGISRDITDRKLLEEALRENLQRHYLILKNANEGIIMNEFTPRGPGKFLEINEAACRILGMTIKETQDVNLIDLDTPEMKQRAPEILQEIMQNNHVVFQTSYVTKDKKEKILDISGSLVELRGHTTMLSVVRDITEQKRAEQALRQANKRLSLMTSVTRHDIRNHLLALNSYLLLSRDTLGDAEKTAEYIQTEERITEAIDREILFTREYENLGVNMPVWQNVRQSIELAVRELDLTGITLNTGEIPDVEILADSLLQKVFFNLVDNSLRHGGETLMQVRFSCRDTGNGLVIHSEDNGSGIPVDEKEMIFERGYGKNTGFGLFFIREILAITGITIRECGEPGKGARFEITVPKEEYRFA